ncbi:MAG TPA: efflux RND transporter permease subunit [Kofleriaceae bacterium]|nr:efflux RND transporter permease subunit [Kofleriaceae bacterium]
MRTLALVAALAIACGGRSSTPPEVVTITVRVPGANASAVEHDVAVPVEEAVNVAGVRSIRTTIGDGVAVVVVTSDRDLTAAIRDRLAGILRDLPIAADPPVIVRADTDTAPVAVFEVSGPQTLAVLSDVARDTIRPELERLPSGARVEVRGAVERRIELAIDPARAAALAVTVDDVARAISLGPPAPGGQLAIASTTQRAGTTSELGTLVVARRGDHEIRLADVATIADTTTPRPNEPLAVAVWLQPHTGRDVVAGKLDAAITALRTSVPAGVSITARSPPAPILHVTLYATDRVALDREATRVRAALGIVPPAPGPEIRIDIDRARAADHGISASEVERVVGIATGASLGTLDDHDIVIRAAETPEALAQLAMRSPRGDLVRLADVMRIEHGQRATIAHYNRLPAVVLRVPASQRDAVDSTLRALPAGVRAAVE